MKTNEQENATTAVDDESFVRADEPKRCASCGKEIDIKEWHPLVTRTNNDGSFQVYAFCDGNCREKWISNNSNSTIREAQ